MWNWLLSGQKTLKLKINTKTPRIIPITPGGGHLYHPYRRFLFDPKFSALEDGFVDGRARMEPATSPLAFGCQKTLNGQIPHRINTARPSIADTPQPPLTSPFWSFLFLFVASQFPIVSWDYCCRHTQPSTQEHGDISAQCARR